MPKPFDKYYDAIIVGARAAGAATALLMARQGKKVLCVDRQQYGSDTMSTHALMRGAVVQLDRWGLLDQLLASGAPLIRQTGFFYSGHGFSVDIGREYGTDGLIAPRRHVLDKLLVDAARAAGAHIVHDTSFLDVIRWNDGRITGAIIRQGSGEAVEIRSRLVIGADGRNSKVARAVDAKCLEQGEHASATIYGYFSGLEKQQSFRWYFSPDAAAGVIPTHDGQSCVFASCRPHEFGPGLKQGVAPFFHQLLATSCPDLATEVADGEAASPLRGFPSQKGHLRLAAGPGWALVGDAGYFKDPCTAHGITDALRDAELLSDAVARTFDIEKTPYQALRDKLSARLFKVTDQIASFDHSMPALQGLHMELSEVMKAENFAMFGEMPQAA